MYSALCCVKTDRQAGISSASARSVRKTYGVRVAGVRAPFTFSRRHVMTVMTLSFDNVVEVVSVMADAFHDYPVMQHILGPETPGASPYPVRLHRLVQLFVSGRAYRREPMLGVRGENGMLVGAAVMTLPGSGDAPPAFVALRESIWAELGPEARQRYEAYAAV